MGFLNSPEVSEAGSHDDHLRYLKTLVAGLYDLGARDTVMVQASFIWLAFDSGMLKVNRGLALAQFPEIGKYPDTELSRQIASSVRSSLYVYFGSDFYMASPDRPGYFWNRGLEITSCDFPEQADV